MATRIKIRRDTAANWILNNPTLEIAEIGLETDTGKFKIGSGIPWNDDTRYYVSVADLPAGGAGGSVGTPVNLTADEDDLSIGPETVIPFFNNTGGPITITGIAGGDESASKRLANLGLAAILLSGEDAASAADNRFASSASIAPGEIVTLIYNSNRWNIFV